MDKEDVIYMYTHIYNGYIYTHTHTHTHTHTPMEYFSALKRMKFCHFQQQRPR